MNISKSLPGLKEAAVLRGGPKRVFIAAYGFEKRCFGWCRSQSPKAKPLSGAVVFKYVHPKGPNKIDALRSLLAGLGVTKTTDVPFNYDAPHVMEDRLERILRDVEADEIILDISGMAKILILLTLCKLENFPGLVRIVYAEAQDYCPTRNQYEALKGKMAASAKFPSRGCEALIRMQCLSSIRMQGQPAILVAFASFNEKLVAHMLGHMSPHRLLLINGRPPRQDYKWREEATQYIHQKYVLEYANDNPLDATGLLQRMASTLDYRETILAMEHIYEQYGLHERIVCAATGSKMQTVGLFLAKMLHRDIQIEYPTPDSYFVKGMSTGVRNLHELVIPTFAEFLTNLRSRPTDSPPQ